MGLPIMTMEFSVGRASQRSAVKSFEVLEPKGTKWHFIKFIPLIGNYMLMMFYTTVGGWMIAYFFKMGKGELAGLDAEGVSNAFNAFLADPLQQILWMLIVTLLGFFICSRGLKNGVEKVSKYMMGALFLIMLVLVVHSFFLSGAKEGLSFYLIPDFERALENYSLGTIIFEALGQAFFTLSLGIGALAIFGSYIDKDHSLVSESLNVVILDTIVAFVSGLIIFPACFTYHIDAGSGPGLIFVTLPTTFNAMAGGQIWGALFFMFLAFAALTTVIAVFENIVAFAMDYGWSCLLYTSSILLYFETLYNLIKKELLRQQLKQTLLFGCAGCFSTAGPLIILQTVLHLSLIHICSGCVGPWKSLPALISRRCSLAAFNRRLLVSFLISGENTSIPVSYTHLDVYKRQPK